MKRISDTAVGIQTGSALMFSAFEDGSEMWTGEGPGLAIQRVRFPESYLQAPAVHVSVSMWDMDGSANQRADIQAANITNDGFDIQFRTWGDTRVARIRASWMAIGAVAHADNWDVA